MTKKNYLTPEVEIVSIYSEGILAASSFTSASGANIKFENDADFDSFFN